MNMMAMGSATGMAARLSATARRHRQAQPVAQPRRERVDPPEIEDQVADAQPDLVCAPAEGRPKAQSHGTRPSTTNAVMPSRLIRRSKSLAQPSRRMTTCRHAPCRSSTAIRARGEIQTPERHSSARWGWRRDGGRSGQRAAHERQGQVEQERVHGGAQELGAEAPAGAGLFQIAATKRAGLE